MKRNLLAILTVMMGYFTVNAQSIEVYTTRDVLVLNNSETTTFGYTSDEMVVESFKIKNISTSTISVKVRKQVLETHGESVSTFCWGVCYPPYINESTQLVEVAANSFAVGTLDVELMPDNNSAGVNRIAYTVFNENNPNDSVRFIVNFDILSSTPEALVAEFKLYPNPTSGELTVSGGEGKQLAIYNAIGQNMGTYTLTSNDEKIDTNSLKNGIYMVLLSENGNTISTRKLIKQ
ncbi:MAG: T9SS type A sorting domain-containing protein [Salinivirgaceae bacterium]|nr:T9SS type A sorting domain-containing protein [Salinivirgaceae bacterium]MDD4746205.1 T9SS type A sorting domain-containing protein [Salinivirgaceae bacterium]MDY0280788.1 T9SS type A sorting domain-containing protein [Salinivirgaceae bacterium]